MGGFLGTMPAGQLNVALSNFAKDFRDQKFVGDLICPRVPVDRQSFQYVVWTQDDFRAPGNTYRAPGDRPQSIRNSYSTDTYFARGHALDGDIPFETEAYSQGLGFSARKRLTTSLTRRLNLAREIDIAGAALSLANFPNGVNVGTPWDQNGATPIEDIENGKEALRQVGIADEEMVLILSSPVVKVLVNNAEIVDRAKYTNIQLAIDIAKLSSVFGVKCVRAGAVQLSQNNAKTWVWGQNAFLGYAQASPSMEDMSAMKTFSWTGGSDTGADTGMVAPGAEGWAVMEWPDAHRSTKKMWQSAEWFYDTKVTATETGYPFLGAVSAETMETVPSDVEG